MKPGAEVKALSALSKEEWREYTKTVWSIANVSHELHPATFPTEIPKRLTKLFSFWGETVLDPFGGVGSTAVAAIREGRRAICIDQNPKFVSGVTARSQTGATPVERCILCGKQTAEFLTGKRQRLYGRAAERAECRVRCHGSGSVRLTLRTAEHVAKIDAFGRAGGGEPTERSRGGGKPPCDNGGCGDESGHLIRHLALRGRLTARQIRLGGQPLVPNFRAAVVEPLVVLCRGRVIALIEADPVACQHRDVAVRRLSERRS